MPRRGRWRRVSPASRRSAPSTTTACDDRSRRLVQVLSRAAAAEGRPAKEKLMSDGSPAEKPRIRVESTATNPSTGDQVAGVALVTLDRPEVLNALDYETLRQLVEALE